MRIRHLDLRYGRFTDHRVDFGAAAPGRPDLHVIYGPNEAGKSTLFSAWLDLLYGIHGQTPFAFLHSYAAMRISAGLELAGGVQEVVRIKKPSNSLLDARGRPLAETALLAELGGIDRDAYRSLFWLDDDTLTEGGEELLAARGDLGQLLFAGSSGLADLGGRLAGLHEETDGFFKPRARSTQLGRLQEELEALKAERAQIDTQASRHAELAEIARQAQARHDEVSAARGVLQGRKEEIQRLLGARPGLARLRGLKEQLAPLAALPDAPAGWVQALPALRDEEIGLDTQISTNTQELARLTEAVAAINVDEGALEGARQLTDAAPLRARHQTAQKDLPDRRQELRELDQAIVLQLRQIERETEVEPAGLLLPASVVERLRELIEAHSGIATAHAQAEGELTEARHRLKAAADRLQSLAPAAPAADDGEIPFDSLREALEALRSGDHGARQRLAERASFEAMAVLDDRLRALAPWRGEPDGLLAMTVPDAATLQRWRTAQQALQRRVSEHDTRIEGLKGQCVHLTAHAEAKRATGLVTDHEASRIRAARDRAWAEHRLRLDETSARAFEELLQRDDEVVAQRFGHVAELAQLHAQARTLLVAQADLSHAEDARALTVAENDALAQSVRAGVAAVSALLPQDWTLTQLEDWLQRRALALEARAAARQADRDVRQAAEDGARLRRRLATALGALRTAPAAEADEAALTAAAQSLLDSLTKHRHLQQEHAQRQRDVADRERALARAAAAKDSWDAQWQGICGACWLAERGTPTIAAVRAALAVIRDLSSSLGERTALAQRVRQMEDDIRAFQEAVIRLAEQSGLAPGKVHAVMELVAEIERRGQQALTDRARRDQERQRLEAARVTARQLAAQKAALDLRRQEMTLHFGVDTLAQVARQLEQVALRDRLRREVAEGEQQILTTLPFATLAEAEAALDAADHGALQQELNTLTAQAQQLELAWKDSHTEQRDAQRQIDLIGGDARVAQIEEQRRTLLLEIEDRALRYLRLRAGTAATEQALRLYRERHRGSMLERASEALRVMSRDAYTRLTTQPDGTAEVLVALAADGSSKTVAQMSKGTRFQLYLALRVAGYQEIARSRSPVPFMADDIMETFDDLRAEETLRLLADVARSGQVIYLTHHRHLCELARQVCPTVTIHELPAAAAGSSGSGAHGLTAGLTA